MRLAGRLSEALAAFDAAIEDFPFVEAAYVGKGKALVQGGRYLDATAFYREAFERFPDSPYLTSGFAALSTRQGNWHEALAAYDRLIRRSARNLRARLDKARVLNRMGQPDLAMAELTVILSSAPQHRAARNELAVSHYLIGDYAEAVKLTHGSWQPRGVQDWARLFVRALSLDKLHDGSEADRILRIGARSQIPRVQRYMSSALAILRLSQNRISEAQKLISSVPGEASSLIELHVSRASAPGANDNLGVLDVPAPHVPVRDEIVRRFSVITGGRVEKRSADWIYDEERKLLLFDATADDWLMAA